MRRETMIFVGATTIFLLLALGVGWTVFHGSPAWSTGSPRAGGEPDMSVEEAGQFAGRQFEGTRKQHLKNAARYQSLQFKPVPCDVNAVAPALRSALENRLNSRDADRSVLVTLPPDALTLLAERTARLLMATAGCPVQEYIRSLSPATVLRLPPNETAMRAILTNFVGGGSASSDLQSTADLATAFERLLNVSTNLRSGGARVTGWSDQPAGCECSIAWIAADDERRDLLGTRVPQADKFYWYGMLAQSAFVFHQAPVEWREALKLNKRILWSNVILIVRTLDGDTYPLHLQFWYDAPRRTWWLEQASRRSSIRAANGPPPAF